MKKTIFLFIICTALLVSCNNDPKQDTTSTDSKVDATIKVFSNNKSLSSSRYGKKGVEIFRKNNPGVEVTFEFSDSKEYEQKLKLKLLARDSDLDVFIADNNIVPELVKNQAFYDLSSFDSIVKTLNSMSYGIKQLCSAGETIIGVPQEISLDVWSVNESLLESLNLQLPEGSWNWDDFYEFSTKTRKDLNNDGEMDTYAMACNKQFFISYFMLRNYNCAFMDVINGYASFNRKEFVDLIKISKKLFDEKLIMENNDIPRTKLENTLFTMKNPISIEKNEKIIPVPSLSSKRVYPAGVSLFCVNKFSTKADKAVEYITTLTLKDLHEESPRIELLYEDLFSKRVDVNCSKKYFDILKYITLYRNQADLSIFSSNTLNDYYSGKITAEEAAEKIDVKAQIILKE